MTIVIEKVQLTLDCDEYMFYCPGCQSHHTFKVNGSKPNWVWNGSLEKPTFNPSLLIGKSEPRYRCHLYVENGMIKYLDDCFHEFKGKIIQMVPME